MYLHIYLFIYLFHLMIQHSWGGGVYVHFLGILKKNSEYIILELHSQFNL